MCPPHRKFYELLSELMSQATSVEDLTEAKVRAASVQLELLKDKIPGVYEGLVELAASLREENIEMFKMKAAAAQALGGGGGNSGGQDKGEAAAAGAAGESRNAFALNVLKKVRMKLEGREPDPLRKSSVQEQGTHIKKCCKLKTPLRFEDDWLSSKRNVQHLAIPCR